MNLSVRLTRAAKRIEELEAQLVEARAENARLKWVKANQEPWLAALGRLMVQYKITHFPGDVLAWRAERDAAIERGVAVWEGAEQQRGMLLLLLWMRTIEHDDDHEALDRAEAREKALREAFKQSAKQEHDTLRVQRDDHMDLFKECRLEPCVSYRRAALEEKEEHKAGVVWGEQ